MAQGSVGSAKHTQVRLVVNGMMTSDTKVNLMVSFGVLKSTHSFNVTAESSITLTLDTDLSRPIMETNGGGCPELSVPLA